MTPKPTNIWDTDAGLAPNLEPLVGQRVEWAGVLPLAPTLVLRFPRQVVMIEPGQSVGCKSLVVEVGDIKPGANFSDLETLSQLQTPHTRDLIGRRFTGMEADLIHFDHKYGVVLGFGGKIKWKKRAT
jgi:hypothetical protein